MNEKISESSNQQLVPGRECGSCTMCCKIMGVESLEKPLGVWCEHCDIGTGCRIYEERPHDCRDFICGYLSVPGLDEKWFPLNSKLIVIPEENSGFTVRVDPSRPDAWKVKTFYDDIKAWSQKATANHGKSIIRIGDRVVVILPDKDVDIGLLGDDEGLQYRQISGEPDPQYDVFKVKIHSSSI